MTKPLVPRNPQESHRAATPLELLFDLCFVVAIAQAAIGLHHGIAANHILEGLFSYLLVFFALWWAWMNFTWYASAFDNDDVPYRLKVLLQMTGVLVLAAGIPSAFNDYNFLLITFGYTIIRVSMIAMWWRAATSSSEFSITARRYALGLTLCQLGWIAIAFIDHRYWLYGWAIFVIAELLVPIIAERARPTHWHPHHIIERYGLLLIIVIGESVLGVTVSIQTAISAADHQLRFLPLIVGAPVIFFSMWWIYFLTESFLKTSTGQQSFIWGYSHYVVFASAAAVGAGIGVMTDFYTTPGDIPALNAGLAVAIPCALYLVFVCIAKTQVERISTRTIVTLLGGALACLLTGWLPWQPLGTAIVMALVTAVVVRIESQTLSGEAR